MRSPGELQGVWAAESPRRHDRARARAGPDRVPPAQRRLATATPTSPARRSTCRRARRCSSACSRSSRDGRRARGHGRGIGLGTRHVGDGRSQMRVTLLPDARIEVETGLPDQGAGSHTVARGWWRRRWGSTPARSSVRYASTLGGVFDSGAGGSKSTHAIGAVAVQTGTELKQRLQELAAEVMGWPARDPSSSATTGSWPAPRALPSRRSPRASRAASRSRSRARTCPSPTHAEGVGNANFTAFAIEVEVDADTGEVTLDRRAAGGRRRHDHQSRCARGPAEGRLRLRPRRGDDGGPGDRRTAAC